MSSAFKILLLVLGIIEVVIGFKMDVFTRRRYSRIKVKDLQGLIKWEKITSIFMGVIIIFFAFSSFLGAYHKYNTAFIIAIIVLMFVTYIGRKRFI